jgi:A/G-specific adenine glycosylase
MASRIGCMVARALPAPAVLLLAARMPQSVAWFNSNEALFTAVSASDKAGLFSAQLIDWQRRHGRHDLPWQGPHRDPYRVWLSEIMLQQTQVQTAIPYFHRFLKRFPDLQALANATEQEVLALWSGLGYYQRGRNLLACAQVINTRHQGKFPDNAASLAQLPGIGPSTAAAIAATVFQERVAILDGNVKRVLARVTRADAPWGSPMLERLLWKEAAQRLPADPFDMPVYTQAIMDLGALVCTSKKPRCDICPVQQHCTAHASDVVHLYPRSKPKRTTPTKKAHWCVLSNSRGLWLMQQPLQGIWPGLWVPWQLDLDAMPTNWQAIASGLRDVVEIRHAFSHYKLDISVGVIHWQGDKGRRGQRQHRASGSAESSAVSAPQSAPMGLQFFEWARALEMPLPAPVRRLVLRLGPFGTRSGGELHRRNRTRNAS